MNKEEKKFRLGTYIMIILIEIQIAFLLLLLLPLL